jgi:glucokinase
MLLGIEIGGSKLQLVLGNNAGEIAHRRMIKVDPAAGREGICALIEQAVEDWKGSCSWRGVGCGFGGPVDWRTGLVCRSHQVAGWNDFPLGDWLGGLCQAPVRVDNDSNTAALAEARFGAGRGFNPVFYTNSGSGVGGGLVVDGKIYHGAAPGEAEIGHIRLDQSGVIVEDRCSGWAVDRRIRALQQSDPQCLLARMSCGEGVGGEARFLPAALQQGDTAARQILRETADDLALALSHVVQLLHPAVVVLGGGLALVGEPWRLAVANALARHVMAAFAPGPVVRLTSIGADVVPVGALALAARAAAPEAGD